MKKYLFYIVSIFFIINIANTAPNKISAQIDKARKCAMDNDFEQAFKIYNDILKKNPKSKDALINRAETYILLDKYHEAIRDFNQLLAFDTLNAFAYFRRGFAKSKCDSLNYAMSDYKKSLELDSTNPEVLYYSAIYNLNFDLVKVAADDFEKVLKVDKTKNDIYKYLGYAYYKLENFDLSIENYNKALQYFPKDAEIYFNRGNTLLKMKKYNDAVKDYSAAIGLDSLFEDAYTNRAYAHYLSGDEATADRDKQLLAEAQLKKANSINDNIDINKCKTFVDPTGNLKIYLPEAFNTTFLADSEIVSMGVTREKLDNLYEGFLVGVVVEKILDPQKTIKSGDVGDLVGYIKSYAESTTSNTVQSFMMLEKQKPLGRYGAEAFYQLTKHELKFSANSEPVIQYLVGFIKPNTLVIYRFIFPTKLAVKYEPMVQSAIDRFEF